MYRTSPSFNEIFRTTTKVVAALALLAVSAMVAMLVLLIGVGIVIAMVS